MTKGLATEEERSYNRSLIEASLDPLVTISPEGKITDVNEATVKVTGVPRRKLIGTDFCSYFTEPEQAQRGYQHVFLEGSVVDYPLTIRHVDGRLTDVLYNASVYKNSAGKVLGVFAAARDVTERLRAEEALRKKESDLRRAQAVAHVGSWNLDVFTGELSWSEETYRIFRIPLGTPLTYVRFLECVHPHDRTRVSAAWAAALTGAPYDIQHRILADGEERHVSERAELEFDEQGRPLRAMGTAQDITERKRAETALQESERRFRSLVVATSQIVWTTDPGGHVVGPLPSWQEYTGQSEEEVQGWGWTEALHPDDLEPTIQVWEKAVARKSLYDVEYRVRGRDARYRTFWARGVPVLADDGSVLEWVGTCTDITERKKAEEEIRKLNAELEQRVAIRTAELAASNKELEAFVYAVAHDLRAPLRHIDGFSRLLLDEQESQVTAEARRYLKLIRTGTQRMGCLLEDLLNLSRVGRQEPQLQLCGLNSLVEEVLEGLKSEFKERRIEWRIGRLPFIDCDPGLIKQVFANLLSNALKFTRPRETAIIDVGQITVDGEKAVFVSDNGVGFSMKYVDKLFGVFQRLHRQEDFEGTGVGLATVQRIIHKHRGRIWAEAELDKGASFYFTLGRTE